ncbi:sigma-70 family RNA polymerase sigma factor [Planctomycetota bacterium]
MRLFIKHEAALRAYVRMLVPTWDGIDEVIQEASIVLWQKFGQLDDPANFMVWAKVVLRFQCLRYRRDKARDRHVFKEDFYDLLAQEELEDQAVNYENQLHALRSCLSQIKPDYREMLLAPYAGQGRLKKMAEVSGRTPNSIYKLLCRLRRKLSQCVENRLTETLNHI